MAFEIESTTERLESVAGLALIGEIAHMSGLTEVAGRRRSYNNAVVSMYGLLAQGRSSFEEIDLYRGSDLFGQSLGLSFVPAQETLRLYLERMAEDTSLLEKIRTCNMAILQQARPTPVEVAGRYYLPVDVDVSILDNTCSHKEGVSRTYRGKDGYAPIFSYIGSEGYMLDCELRPGSSHCLRRNLALAKKLPNTHPLLFRMDGGNDAVETISALIKTEGPVPFLSLSGTSVENPSPIGMRWRRPWESNELSDLVRTSTPA